MVDACLQVLADLKGNRIELPLSGGGFLRSLRGQDVTDSYVQGLNDPRVSRFLVSVRDKPQTSETVRAFVVANHNSVNSILFGIYFDGRLRGTTRLHDIDGAQRDASIGIALFDVSVWHRGLASAALKAVAEYALGTLQLKRLNAGIESENIGSQRVFARVGFVRCSERKHLHLSVQHWVLDAGDAIRRDRK